nr:MAG TPA: hypothetical protein [Caudoviricetes sp.]
MSFLIYFKIILAYIIYLCYNIIKDKERKR